MSDTSNVNAPVGPARETNWREQFGIDVGAQAADFIERQTSSPPVRVPRKEREALERATLTKFRKRSKAERRAR